MRYSRRRSYGRRSYGARRPMVKYRPRRRVRVRGLRIGYRM